VALSCKLYTACLNFAQPDQTSHCSYCIATVRATAQRHSLAAATTLCNILTSDCTRLYVCLHVLTASQALQLQSKLSEAAARVQALSAENYSKSTNIEVTHLYRYNAACNFRNCCVILSYSHLEAAVCAARMAIFASTFVYDLKYPCSSMSQRRISITEVCNAFVIV
jgi:hypothetical protein